MWDLVQVTVQYSNAVLLAVLPHVSDFAKTLELPVSQPVLATQVLEFKCDPRRDHVGGVVILTNHFEFTFLDGRVCVYRSPESYYSLQDPELIPKFYGTVKVSQGAALKAARQAVKKLGYSSAELHTDTAPESTPPESIGFHSVPRYRFRWTDPQLHGDGNSRSATLLDMEVNASNRRIEMFVISSSVAKRPGLEVDVVPPNLKQQTRSDALSNQPRAVWINKNYALAMLNAVLPQFSEFASSANLSVKVPITVDDVDLSRYACESDNGIPSLQVYLKNGDRFNYSRGRIAAYYAHDAFFKFPNTGSPDNFQGARNMSTNDAVVLVKETMSRLGYKDPPMVCEPGSPLYSRSDKFTRFFVSFRRNNEALDTASFEVDLEKKQLKSVYMDDPSLWRDSPLIDVPMTTQTNRPIFVEKP
jgi:hypothetical protein